MAAGEVMWVILDALPSLSAAMAVPAMATLLTGETVVGIEVGTMVVTAWGCACNVVGESEGRINEGLFPSIESEATR